MVVMQAQPTTVAGFPGIAAQPPDGSIEGSVDRPTVVFVHGAFADHVAFTRWVEHFAAAGYPSFAVSRRGRLGVGPDRAEGLTFSDYVDDTIAVLDALGPLDTAPVVIGHSLGGLIAQRLAEMGRTRAIALLAPAPPGMLTARPMALRRFAPNLGRIMTGRPFIVGNDACSVLALNHVPESERPAIHAHLTPESGRVYRSAMLGTIRVDAARVTAPVYVASGTDDRIISTRLAAKTARHYGVEPRLYSGHGHWLLEEPGWEAIADDVLTWLKGV